MHEVGHPVCVHQGTFADRFDIDQSTISRDLTALAEHVDNTVGNRRTFVSQLVFDRAIGASSKKEEWRKAAQTAIDWNE